MSMALDQSLDGTTMLRERRLVYLVGLMLAIFLGWAWYFPLVEVSSGQGTVVPSSREQVIQSLEGGIVASLAVSEGSVVDADEVLAQLDPTRSVSNVDEAQAKYSASIAASARLRAELQEADTITFPAALNEARFDDLRANETALFQSGNHQPIAVIWCRQPRGADSPSTGSRRDQIGDCAAQSGPPRQSRRGIAKN